MAYAPNNGGGVSQIIVAVIVGVIWLFNAVMAKVQQGKKKADEPDEQPNAAPAADTQLTEADRSYREIQEEIRRRIARRNNPTAPVAPVQRPAPAPYVRSPNALPPIRSPQPVPTLLRRVAPPPQPAPMAVSDDDEDNRISMPAAPSQPWGQNMMENTRASDVRAIMARPTDEAAAYAQPDDRRVQPGAALRAALAVPGAARQAFLFREIFDRPLCLRPGPGGHETLNW